MRGGRGEKQKRERNVRGASDLAILRGQYWLTRIVFLRCLGFVYLVAFLIALNDNAALLGENGLLPATRLMKRVQHHLGRRTLFEKVLQLPTVFWFIPPTAECLRWVAATGAAVSGAVAVRGAANLPMMFLLWALYHSLVNVGQTWYSFGWESQLLETGFLAMFLVPWLSLSRFPDASPPPLVCVWGYRWLLFRIMLGAGLIKMRGDLCWQELTCMEYHYQTQPNPNPLSLYFHHLPSEGWHKFEVVVNHAVELVIPWGLLLGRRCRWFAGWAQIMFQAALVVSGNLSFLNWLTAVPAVFSFDDLHLATCRLFFFGPRERRLACLAAARAEGFESAVVAATSAGEKEVEEVEEEREEEATAAAAAAAAAAVGRATAVRQEVVEPVVYRPPSPSSPSSPSSVFFPSKGGGEGGYDSDGGEYQEGEDQDGGGGGGSSGGGGDEWHNSIVHPNPIATVGDTTTRRRSNSIGSRGRGSGSSSIRKRNPSRVTTATTTNNNNTTNTTTSGGSAVQGKGSEKIGETKTKKPQLASSSRPSFSSCSHCPSSQHASNSAMGGSRSGGEGGGCRRGGWSGNGSGRWKRLLRWAANCLLVGLVVNGSIPVVKNMAGLGGKGQVMNTSFDSFRIVNTYGAFGSVTKTRGEIILKGTRHHDPFGEETEWEEYEFKCKPGNVNQRPCVISPFHYRLDWQMWFAAFQNYQVNPWLLSLISKLLSRDPETRALAASLLRRDPFLAASHDLDGVKRAGGVLSGLAWAKGEEREGFAGGNGGGNRGAGGDGVETPLFIKADLYLYEYTTPPPLPLQRWRATPIRTTTAADESDVTPDGTPSSSSSSPSPSAAPEARQSTSSSSSSSSSASGAIPRASVGMGSFSNSEDQGQWWTRKLVREYLPPISLENQSFQKFLRSHGLAVDDE